MKLPSWCVGVCIAVAASALVAGCDAKPDASGRIDAQWHRSNMVDDLLPRWTQAASTDSGFMRTAVDRKWQPSEAQPGYLTEHARLVYVLIVGYEVTKDKQQLEAAKRGADFMLDRFHDPANGGFYQRVAADGKVISDSKNTYDHAFVLLALSHMARITGDVRYREAALATWKDIDLWLRDGKGGFFGELPRNFEQPGRGAQGSRSQNPLMHMFEALLALHEATRDPAALSGAKKLGDFVVYKLMQGTADSGAFIPEWYDANWKPMATKELGGYTDIGHQFEWVHLLLEAEAGGISSVYAPAAARLLEFAVKRGYDETEGGSFDRLYPDGSLSKTKHWWPQTEALRAFFLSASASGQKDMWRRYDQTLRLVQDQFVDKDNGGWFIRPRSVCERETCPPKQVEPYHMVAMHRSALAIAERQR